MPSRRALYVLWVLLAACATAPPPSAERPLEAGFAGTWAGTASFATPSGRGATYASVPVRIRLLGNTARVEGVCPTSLQEGSVPAEKAFGPALDMAGAGAAAVWTGTLRCPTVELLGCAAVRTTYTHATVTLYSTPHLAAVALGEAEGCGTTTRLLLTFVGAK